MKLTDFGALTLVALLWGVNFVAAKVGLTAFTLWEFRVAAFGGGALVLVVIALCTGTSLRLRRRGDTLRLLLAGSLSVGGFGVFSALALLHTTAGRATIGVYTMPIWVVLLASVLLNEPLTRRRILSLALGASGLLVLALPQFLAGEWLGLTCAIAAAVSWALGTVLLKRAAVDAPPITTTAWQLIAGSAVCAVGLVLAPRQEPLILTGDAVLGVLYNLVFGTVIAYLIWFTLLRRIPAGAAGIGTLLVPVFGVLASFALLGEIPTSADLAGLALIVLAAGFPLFPDRAASPGPAAPVPGGAPSGEAGASDQSGGPPG
ncbi:DMT family transporter, partial [Leucobacter sp. M11]|uniref:DMT family transporter n=1 Tax=Leucobacter sp. M11 TaxID=2993565 RepID=UPI002D7E8765